MSPGQRYGVEIRAAQPLDAAEFGRLLAQVGIALSPRDAADRLEALRNHAESTALVAVGYGGLSGLVAASWTPVLFDARPVARITTLVVDAEERRHGIGRLLLKAVAHAARIGGCNRLELGVPCPDDTTGPFCLGTGFEAVGGLYVRQLRKRG